MVVSTSICMEEFIILQTKLYRQSNIYMKGIDSVDFKCIFCRQTFTPPYNLPYIMACTHSICSLCLQRVQDNHQNYIICPEDLEQSKVNQLRSNVAVRRALQRLVKQHKSFEQNNQLLCIQSLSKHFQNTLEAKCREKGEFKQLLERIIQNEIKRLKKVYEHIMDELEGPFKLVKQWKQMVKEYLGSVKNMNRNQCAAQISRQLNYYIEEGRRIKSDLNQYQTLDFNQIANEIAINPTLCLRQSFSLQKFIGQPKSHQQSISSHFNSQDSLQFQTKGFDKQKARFNFSIAEKENMNERMKLLSPMIEKHKSTPEEFATTDFRYESQSKHKSKLSQLLTTRDAISKKVSVQLPLLERKNEEEDNLPSDRKLFIYSPSKDVTLVERPDLYTDQILLTDKQEHKNWEKDEQRPLNERRKRQKINFMQEWEVDSYIPSQDEIHVEKRQPFNWQKQKNCYIQKMQMLKVQQAIEATTYHANSLELINYPISQTDLSLYLQHWQNQPLEVIKIVKANMNDNQMNQLLNFVFEGDVHTVVLSGNNLTQISLDALLNFTKLSSKLRNIYLSKNSINTLRGHTREKINLLRSNGINLYI